jgi:protein phosphatase
MTGSVPSRKPSDADIDVYGLTHRGKVRKENQDHFLISSLHQQMVIQSTSLPEIAGLPVASRRVGSLSMVADGVGSGAGEEASRMAVQAVSRYVVETAQVCHATEMTDPDQFARVLEEAALRCHAEVLEHAAQDPDGRTMATTLTLWLGLWPEAYLLQVGDSRCYVFHGGRLTQVSRDQNMAQDLIDQGILTRTSAANTRWANVLSSAIGGQEAAPVVTRLTREWGTIVMLCSDGLTKHVPDDRIAQRLGSLKSSKQACEALLQDALDDGGSDNITIVIGRTVSPK